MKTAITLIILVAAIGLFTAAQPESRAESRTTPRSSDESKKMESKPAPAPKQSQSVSKTDAKSTGKTPAKTASTSAAKTPSKPDSKPLAKSAVKATTKAAPDSTAETAGKTTLTPAQSKRLLDLLNQGTPEDLAGIPGIAKTRAASIAKARPFAQVGDLILVDGVGAATYEKVLAHGKVLAESSARSAETPKKS